MSNCCSLTGSLSIGQGERGKSLEFTWRGTELGIRVEGDAEYQFVDLGISSSVREIQLQVSEGYIQWKYADEEVWNNLIAISELKGDRGLDGKSAYELWLENGNEGTVDDFLLSLKGKDGEKGEQGLPGRDGVDGTNGVDGKDGITPNIQIGTVTTLEPGQQATVENVGTLENPIFNFGIPRGEDGDGSGDASIDDTTIRKDATWSSEKIEDFVLTNTDTVWTDISGENLSIDYTKEGHLREVEIWGNTVQSEEDLSDIRHLGELYVDDEGQPILDELGREQYKVEIESCNKNLLDGSEKYTAVIGGTNGSQWVAGGSGNRISYKLKCNPNTKYTITKTGGDRFSVFTNSYDFNPSVTTNLDTKINFVTENYCTFTTNSTAKVICIYVNLSSNDEIEIQVEHGDKTNFISHQSHKTTILLPCQLMKVGDVYDRLYWDSSKNKYVVEKKLDVPNDYNQAIDESLVLEVPQLMETSITEELKIQTYKDKTHIFVAGGIDGSIKAKAPLDGGQAILSLTQENKELKSVNQQQDELINTTMLATDEVFSLLEPLLANMISDLNTISPLINMYVAMVQRGLKKIEDVPVRYREQVIEILNKLED